MEADEAEFRRLNDWENARKQLHDTIDFAIDYYKTVEDLPVKSNVKPRFLAPQLPTSAPEEPQSFSDALATIRETIVPGMTHWQSPRFAGYFSANSTPPGMCGEILSGMFNCIGFSWAASPAESELETVAMDWLAQLIGLPNSFLTSSPHGGGIIQSTASEATLVGLLAAKARAVAAERERLGREQGVEPHAVPDVDILSGVAARFVVYCSEQAHSSVRKAAMVAGTGTDAHHFRALPTEAPGYGLTGATLRAAVEEDEAAGRKPLYVVASLGSTGIGAVDRLRELGEVAAEKGLWLHVDAAWAGAALVCPEHRWMIDGVHLADSFNFNPHKWLLTNFDCSAMWVQNKRWLHAALSLTPEYLRSKEYDSGQVVDYRDLQVPLGRRFRAIKLWLVMNWYGARGLRAHIRTDCALAERLAAAVEADDRFELVVPRVLSLVCFRLRGGEAADARSLRIIDHVNASGESYLVHTLLDGRVVVRAAFGNPLTRTSDVDRVWAAIQAAADAV